MVEPRLPIRLIALDIDGTLVGDDLILGERTRAAVAEAQRRGIAVSLVTGRMATSAVPFAEALGLTGPVVAQQGALISSHAGRRLQTARAHAPPLPAPPGGNGGDRALVPRARSHAPLQLPGVDDRGLGRGAAGGVPALRGRSASHRGRCGRTRAQARNQGGGAGRGPPLARPAGGGPCPFRRPRGSHAEPPALPGVPCPGRVEGQGRPMAREAARRSARATALPSATSTTTWR